MVSTKSVEDQLRKISFNRGWNRAETEELAAILLPDEEIFECVNGWYEGGFALLTATNVRVLLVDKKPFRFLTVEDVRFDTINQIDYSHRAFNASICITAGLKSLVFRSYNQPRLRKLISHVQHRMAEIKRIEQAQKEKSAGNARDMDDQLKSYLLSQYEQHQSLKLQHEPYLLPTNLDQSDILNNDTEQDIQSIPSSQPVVEAPAILENDASTNELYQDGIKEIFGKYRSDAAINPIKTLSSTDDLVAQSLTSDSTDDDSILDPLKIAYSKLPLILSIKRQSVHATT